MIGIFLDDERYPKDVTWVNYQEDVIWRIVRDLKTFKEACVDLGHCVVFSFDHDIQDFSNGQEVTGYDCLKWMIDYCFENNYKIPKCYFHTMNPIGKQNMESYYNNALSFENQSRFG